VASGQQTTPADSVEPVEKLVDIRTDQGSESEDTVSVTDKKWYDNLSECTFHQNSIDTVFVCFGSQVYVLPKD